MPNQLDSLKPVFAGICGFIVQFADIDNIIKLIVGVLTICYVGAKLWMMVLRNPHQLLSPWTAWKNRKAAKLEIKEDKE